MALGKSFPAEIAAEIPRFLPKLHTCLYIIYIYILYVPVVPIKVTTNAYVNYYAVGFAVS